MLAPGAGAADPSEPSSSPAAPALEPTHTAACSASPVTGSGPVAVELPAASPAPPAPAESDAAESDQGAGAPVPTAATADPTARQGRVASPGVNAVLGRTAGQPFPRGPRTIRPHHRTPHMAPLCGGTTSEGTEHSLPLGPRIPVLPQSLLNAQQSNGSPQVIQQARTSSPGPALTLCSHAEDSNAFLALLYRSCPQPLPTAGTGPAEPGPSAGASPQAVAAPLRLATPDQPVQHGSAAGVPSKQL